MFPQALQQPIYDLETTKQVALGTVYYDPKDQGRTAYKYVEFGGTSTINPGLLLVAAAAPSNSTGLALSSSNTTAQLAASSTTGSIIVTNGATAVVTDQFADGVLEVLGSGGIQAYRITGNTADSSGGADITVTFNGPLRNTAALVVGTNTVNLRQSEAYKPTASTTQSKPVGVTIMSVPNTSSTTNYGWVQIAGEAFVQATSGTKGYPVTQDLAGTAGYVANTAAGAAETVPQIGIFKESASGSLASVQLQLN